eukprot:TRINITY_DN9967_c0_g1_i1.p2 TRINITY_DN9967_c0_g1~~TRINITY_DN9967_c0_g1_i1.p2  ORF type:complete len:130 (+),score=39.12 TRINITY_DN9967_c0_g1_i1:289-678(+)
MHLRCALRCPTGPMRWRATQFVRWAPLWRQMHSTNIVHGDLTSSNVLAVSSSELVLIDFGLVASSSLVEDRAVDLYVLERALVSTHGHYEPPLFDTFAAAYAAVSAKNAEVLVHLEDVRSRGRKKLAFG